MITDIPLLKYSRADTYKLNWDIVNKTLYTKVCEEIRTSLNIPISTIDTYYKTIGGINFALLYSEYLYDVEYALDYNSHSILSKLINMVNECVYLRLYNSDEIIHELLIEIISRLSYSAVNIDDYTFDKKIYYLLATATGISLCDTDIIKHEIDEHKKYMQNIYLRFVDYTANAKLLKTEILRVVNCNNLLLDDAT